MEILRELYHPLPIQILKKSLLLLSGLRLKFGRKAFELLWRFEYFLQYLSSQQCAEDHLDRQLTNVLNKENIEGWRKLTYM